LAAHIPPCQPQSCWSRFKGWSKTMKLQER
jgi:hypothetical protein